MIERLGTGLDRIRDRNPNVTSTVRTNERTGEMLVSVYIADIETTRNFLSFDYLNIYFVERGGMTVVTKIEI